MKDCGLLAAGLPSDQEFEAKMRALGFKPNLEQLGFMRAGYDAGYHTRDAEVELAQHSAHQRGQTVAAQERRIAELEAEAAELRETLREKTCQLERFSCSAPMGQGQRSRAGS